MNFGALRHRQLGFTLVEMLIGSAVTIIVLGSLATLAVQQIRVANRVYALSTVNRSFMRLSDSLRADVQEACILQGDAYPRNTATLPDTPCRPLRTSACAGTASTDLRMLIRMTTAAGAMDYTTGRVRYWRDASTNELRRDGPTVSPAGVLNTTIVTNQRVMSNVTGFVPTVSADCTWVSAVVTVAVPASSDTVQRTIALYSGASETID